MTNTEAIERCLPRSEDDSKAGRRCLWQIGPDELPKDLSPMCLELWQRGSEIHLFQLHLDIGCDRKNGWRNQVEGVSHFVERV